MAERPEPEDASPGLLAVLERSQHLGFLGPGAVDVHVAHAGRLIDTVAEGKWLDLGSGGGVPGLILAVLAPRSRWVLLDSNVRRTAFLEEAVAVLGLRARVAVVRARAEEAARSELRGQADGVVARSFGPPAVVAECAAAFLRPGGRLLVAEPPDPSVERWPAAGLAQLGLARGAVHAGWQTLIAAEPVSERYPRRTGVPQRRPLW